ncbi:MAG: hypothetical protein R3304_08375 [Longimicrobiales bacterium]|nr:hypothetical protein [Longimicrobiales bacterium]
MTRLFLLFIACILTWLYFDETRRILLDVAEPIALPVLRWSTEDEMRQMARNVVEHERLTGELPSGPAWLGWLDYRYAAGDMKRDPWSSVYQLEFSEDSVWILSLGPDRVRATADDFRVGAPRG